jgi:hypothetical protein
MKTVSANIIGSSPYSQSAPIQSVRSTGESHDAFELRTWKERLHVDEKGIVFIPPMAIKNMLSDVAKFLSESVPGKGKATFTKHFDAGVMVIQPCSLGIHIDDVKSERLFVPSDGMKGGSSRVWKTFPLIMKWETSCEIIILDPVLIDNTAKVKEYLVHAGKFIGLGRFRPRNGGFYGRFEISNFKVAEGV